MKQLTARDCLKLSLARIGQVHELKKKKEEQKRGVGSKHHLAS